MPFRFIEQHSYPFLPPANTLYTPGANFFNPKYIIATIKQQTSTTIPWHTPSSTQFPRVKPTIFTKKGIKIICTQYNMNA